MEREKLICGSCVQWFISSLILLSGLLVYWFTDSLVIGSRVPGDLVVWINGSVVHLFSCSLVEWFSG